MVDDDDGFRFTPVKKGGKCTATIRARIPLLKCLLRSGNNRVTHGMADTVETSHLVVTYIYVYLILIDPYPGYL